MAKESAEEKLLKMLNKSGAPVLKPVPEKKKFNFVFSMQLLNQLLLLGIVLCVVGLIYEMRSGMAMLNNGVAISDDVRAPRTIADIALPSQKDASYYLDKVNSRNIFRPYEASAPKSSGDVNLAKRLAKYKLVGVAWLDLPETASIMIEDTSNKTTYFLRAGEQLEGVTVKTIYTDRVVFSYEHEETTIKL
jgi:hypothetical protein